MNPLPPFVDGELGPAPASTRRLARDLERLVGEPGVSTRPIDRAAAGRDMWPRSILRRPDGAPERPPDLVVWPRSAEEVAAVVRFAAERGVPVTPYGAGSGVLGGAVPVHGGITLDLKRLDRVRRIDREALEVEAEAGVPGGRLEAAAAVEGLTVGHAPSSLPVSTVGGWLATRSAGQASSRYGKIEDLALGVEVALGTGEVIAARRPAAGPDLVDLFLGSEGALGVIVGGTLRLSPAPAATAPRAFRLPGFTAGLDALRAIFRAGLRPAVARLHDPVDAVLALRGRRGPEVAAAARARLDELLALGLRTALRRPPAIERLLGVAGRGATLILVHEGEPDEVADEAARTARLAAEAGGRDLGSRPAEAWLARRFELAFGMPRAFAAGLFTDTVEVAAPWSRLPAVHAAAREAASPHALVSAHLSHPTADGCALYFTLIGRAEPADVALEAHRQAFEGVLDAAERAGATVSHHHGVGLARVGHVLRELGPGGRALLRAAKAACDPAGVLNPGKLAS